MSVDVSIFTGDAHGDVCETFLVGETVSSSASASSNFPIKSQLLSCARKCCDVGVSSCGPGVPFSSISKAITQAAFETPGGFRVVAGIGGHGIGPYFHGPPYIAHSSFEEENEWSDTPMQPGNVFTIEPCIAAPLVQSANGEDPTADAEVAKMIALPVVSRDDGWSVRLTDGALSAQFEEMVLVTDDGHQVLTK